MSEPIRIHVYGDLGDPDATPVVVQVLAGETPEDAAHRYDKACADRARASGFGMFVCDDCDRPHYVCRRDDGLSCRARKARLVARSL